MAPKIVKKGAAVQEDAAQLQLGDEFNSAGCLLISEVQFLLNQKVAENSHVATSVFSKTLAYVNEFAAPLPEVQAMRNILLQDPDLFRPFEITQMCNLLPATAEEARSLIPSLSRIDDDDLLQSLLDQMQVVRQ